LFRFWWERNLKIDPDMVDGGRRYSENELAQYGKNSSKYAYGPTDCPHLDSQNEACQREWVGTELRKITDVHLREYPARL